MYTWTHTFCYLLRRGISPWDCEKGRSSSPGRSQRKRRRCWREHCSCDAREQPDKDVYVDIVGAPPHARKHNVKHSESAESQK